MTDGRSPSAGAPEPLPSFSFVAAPDTVDWAAFWAGLIEAYDDLIARLGDAA